MANILRKAALAGGLAAVLAVGAAATSLAQVVVVDPPYYGGPYGYVAPYGYVSPYGAYAYSPGFRRDWDGPAGYDSTGQSYSWRELGWQPGVPGAAPANPCWPSQRTQNLC
jgi:hypothetical protein